MPSFARYKAQLDRLEAQARTRPASAPVDRAAYDWYAPGCPCSLPPGDCVTHPRARAAQRPPAGDWRVWVMQGGRGSGKSRSGAEFVIDAVKSGVSTRPLLVGQTAADVRDIMVQTILECSPPGFRPKYFSSRRALVWPNQVSALLLSAEDPEQARGPNADLIWADELGAWSRSWETWRNLSLALRKGTTRAMVTTTPRRNEALLRILEQPTTAVTRSSTLDNRRHLSEEFTGQILALYRGTRFEAQEIRGELVETVEGAWFNSFDPGRHVSTAAEFDPARKVVVAIDAGVSRTSACVYFQMTPIDRHRILFSVLGDLLLVDRYSGDASAAMMTRLAELAPQAQIQAVFIDPASSARTSIGPAAWTEYERTWGRLLASAPGGSVCDGLDVIVGLLERYDIIIHPRCVDLIAGFQNYMRARAGGQWLDVPKMNQSPYEDSIDSLRYGVNSAWPEGRKIPPKLHYVRPQDVI